MDILANQYLTELDTDLLSAIVECLEVVLNAPVLSNARFELEIELDEYIPFCPIMNKAVLVQYIRNN